MDLTSKRFAYVVIASDFKEGEGYLVGVAVEGEKGFYATDWRWGADGNYSLARECADEKNSVLFDGDLSEAFKLIASTMRTEKKG